MGLSFREEPSLVEVVGSLRFNVVDDPNISQDRSLGIGLDDPNTGQEMVNSISQEREGNANIGGSDEIQMVYR